MRLQRVHTPSTLRKVLLLKTLLSKNSNLPFEPRPKLTTSKLLEVKPSPSISPEKEEMFQASSLTHTISETVSIKSIILSLLQEIILFTSSSMVTIFKALHSLKVNRLVIIHKYNNNLGDIIKFSILND